jgi:hypothetical protein
MSIEELVNFLEKKGSAPIERTFKLFHRALEIDVLWAKRVTGLHSIVFSDSAFIVFDRPEVAFRFAQLLMRHLISAAVPVRIGIGAGSFVAMRFTLDTTPGSALHSAHFLGTAIVRAYRAESCGVPGLRILLDPDLPIPSASDIRAVPVLADRGLLRYPVTHELNYLHAHVRALHANHLGEAPSVPFWKQDSYLIDEENSELHRRIDEMAAVAPHRFRYHYSATALALDAMQRAISSS